MQSVEEVRACLVGALSLTGADAGDLSIKAHKHRTYISDFLSRKTHRLDTDAARLFEAHLGLQTGALDVDQQLDPRLLALLRQNEFRHWTRVGTFRIVPVMLNASRFYELWIGEKRLGVYGWVSSAAKSISAGEHDVELEAPGKSLNVPVDILDWNGMR